MGRTGKYWPVIRRQGKRLFVWFVVVLLVLTTLFLVYVGTPYQGPAESIAAVEDDDSVTVEETEIGYVLEPATAEAEAGLVFYPGARVHPNAYVSSLAVLAREANVTVIIPEMPLNLAIVDYGFGRSPLGTHAADSARAAYPTVERWYAGGHSLGGAMACRYARTSNTLDGLVLYASYCDVDISDTTLSVLSVAGEADTVLDWSAYEDGLDNLPASARVELLDGVNHTQFGSYRGQDEPSGTSYELAHERLNELVVPWFREEIHGTASEDTNRVWSERQIRVRDQQGRPAMAIPSS